MSKPFLYIEQKKGSGVMRRRLYNFVFNKKIVLARYRGSIAHNLHIPPESDDDFGIDDTDFFELFCYPSEYYFSLEGYHRSGEVKDEISDGIDTVSYEIRKAFQLLSECNPNVLVFLYNRPEHYQHVSSGGKLLLNHRRIFLSRERIKKSFVGYASDQLAKLSVTSDLGFMGQRRKKILEKFGFDTKKAMTAVRLMKQAIELLETGILQVYRDKDRDFLLSIKRGRYSVMDIQEIAKELKEKVEKSYQQSPLPLANNHSHINELLVDVMKIENSKL